MQAESATDSKGRELGHFTFNATGATKALELLGRELGLFVNRIVQTVWDGDLSKLSADQLATLLPILEQIADEEKYPSAPEPEIPAELAPAAEKPPTVQ